MDDLVAAGAGGESALDRLDVDALVHHITPSSTPKAARRPPSTRWHARLRKPPKRARGYVLRPAPTDFDNAARRRESIPAARSRSAAAPPRRPCRRSTAARPCTRC